ncbi:MAG: deoxyribose-phosphate aldolase [Bacteroidetes bacterium]|nr:deoxyribose-phosphate aldolase [Bacteroidota bacterium]
MDRSLVDRIVREVIAQRLGPPVSSQMCRDGVCTDGLCVIHNADGVRCIVEQGAARITSGKGIDQAGGVDPGLARMIDHTMLKAEATPKEIEQLCAEALKYRFASVCINGSHVPLCARLLKGSPVKVCTVIGFPLGAAASAAKAAETELAIREGAQEVDMVINVGMLKAGEYQYVEKDISGVVGVAHRHKVLAKVILETGLLSDEEKVKACVLARRAGADFVKTSTGFGKGGATAGDIALMRRVVGSAMGVKASGGVRSRQDALTMVASGADRIGASASVKIIGGESGEPARTY